MIRLLWRSDVHLSDHAPASRKDDWVAAVFDKLEQIQRVCHRLPVHGVLDGGDFFHTKSPSRNTHKLVRMAAEHHAKYPCPIYCTPGNHDSVYGDYAFLDQQPLGVLYASNTFQRLYDEHEVYFGPVDTNTTNVKAYPYNRKTGWIMGNPFEIQNAVVPVVRVVGIPYHGTQYDMNRLQCLTKGAEDYLVCVAHVLAAPAGNRMFDAEDVWSYKDMAECAPDAFCLAHWHKDQGVQTINGKQFVNLGSMTRGALIQDDLDRKPAVAILTFSKENLQVQGARLKVKPAEEVFDIEAKTRAEARTMTMDAFVQSVKATLVDTAGKSLEETIGGKDSIPEKVRERALSYLERA